MQTQPCIYRERMIMVMRMVMEVTIEMMMEEMMIEAAGELLEMIVQVVEIIETVAEIEMVAMIEGVEVVIIETEVVMVEIEITGKKKKTIQDYSSEDLQEMKPKIKQEKHLVNLEKLKM